MTPVSLWFEFASTYSYPAVMRAEDMARDHGRALQWRVMLLGPIFKAQGLDTSPFVENPIKGAYMWRDMERICEAHGLPFSRPSHFPRGSLLASRIVCRFPDAPWIGLFIRSVYTANFGQDRDIGTPEVITDLLQDADQDPATVITAATDPDNKVALKMQTEAAFAKGIFGAPTFEVEAEIFWGHDRMHTAFAWAETI